MFVEHIEMQDALTYIDDCPVREVLDRVGDKWSVFVIVRLGERTHRFNELHRSIEGISQRMLTITVRSLERDGLVQRTVYATVPPRVDYELTDLGRTLLIPLRALSGWAHEHRDDIRAARRAHDGRAREARDVALPYEPQPVSDRRL